MPVSGPRNSNDRASTAVSKTKAQDRSGYRFADVVYGLTEGPLDEYEGFPYARIYAWIALITYSVAHPVQFFHWADETAELSKALRHASDPKVHVPWFLQKEEESWYNVEVVKLFFFAPFRSPEDHARRAFRNFGSPQLGSYKLRCWAAKEPPRPETVRVKWYPSAKAVRKWPDGLGEIWLDMPLERDGSLNLRPVMRRWGMENCYILDGNRDKPDQERRSTFDVTPLAVNVLLGDFHEVIGVTEKPTPAMKDARRARARVWEALKSMPTMLLRIPIWWLLSLLVESIGATPIVLRDTVLTVLALVALTICDSIALLVSNVVRPAFIASIQVIAVPIIALGHGGQVGWEWATWGGRIACTWVIACLEAVFLSEQEIGEWERTRQRASHPGRTSGDWGVSDRGESGYEDGNV